MKNNLFFDTVAKYDTDKAFYSPGYNDVFFNVREDIKLLFEIGVNRGGSVRMFREYFPNALIVGLEIDKKCYFTGEDRIVIEIGDATKREFAEQVLNTYGNPDIVIDDGSHLSTDMKTSFELFYPHTKFSYVIEDLAEQVKGSHSVNDGIPATVIIHREIDKILSRTKPTCKSIRVYEAICFFMK
jgi:hypothetical protein